MNVALEHHDWGNEEGVKQFTLFMIRALYEQMTELAMRAAAENPLQVVSDSPALSVGFVQGLLFAHKCIEDHDAFLTDLNADDALNTVDKMVMNTATAYAMLHNVTLTP
jgi:2-oxo-4-hydroxy-4-carboxy--5-ureidoimidazoline (OHCU) decarboxylase